MEGDPELSVRLRAVQRAARRGARSVTANRQAMEDAVDVAVARWQAAVVDGRLLQDPEAWAYRIAANLAKSVGAGGCRAISFDEIEDWPEEDRGEGEIRFERGGRRMLRAHLARHGKNLRGRQREVLLKLSGCEFDSGQKVGVGRGVARTP